ncbi:hypothetical protein PFISCL1PPCAC_6730, partial [Pristionchus fissidentatus]
SRYLPSLLHTPASAPSFSHLPPASAAATVHNQQHVPVQGIQHPLNNILLQTAQFMAMNDQLRKEIEQYANLRCETPNWQVESSYPNLQYYQARNCVVLMSPSYRGPALPLMMMPFYNDVRRVICSVRAASLKGGAEAQVAAAAAAAYFLSPPVVGQHAAAAASAAGEMPPSLVAPFGALVNGARLPPPGRKSPLPDSYKTVMCQAWLEASMCSFGENCRFAHGEHELRPMTQPQRANRKYKTKLCEKYTNTGLCPYGQRCLFIHPDTGNNAYIRPDKLEELKKRQNHEEGTKQQRGASGDEEMMKVRLEAPTPSVVAEGVASLSGDSESMQQLQQMMMRTSTPLMMTNTGKQPVAPLSMMNIGVTPIRPRRQELRPHPSWPLEPSEFFDREEEDYVSLYRVRYLYAIGVLLQDDEMMAAEAVAAELMNCGTSTDGRSLRGSCSSYASQPAPAAAVVQQMSLQQHLPRAASPVIGFDHMVGDVTGSPALVDCGTPCSGSGSSSGYLSEGGCCGVITPASGLSSGTASPLDALMLSGGTHSLGSSPPSMLLDSSDFSSSFLPSLSSGVFSSLPTPLGMTISLPPMTSSGCWGDDDEIFRNTFDIDKMAREMAKEFGGL